MDAPGKGTWYSGRMSGILRVCWECGLMDRVDKATGHRSFDIEPLSEVQLTPQWEKYGLRARSSLLPRLERMGRQFAYGLNVPMVTVDVEGNIVFIRVPRGDRNNLPFRDCWRMVEARPKGALLLGMDEAGYQLVLNLASPETVHAAVIGMTGSGKSTLLQSMTLSAELQGGCKVALFDPTGGLADLSGHPSVWRGGLFREAEDCERGLEILADRKAQEGAAPLYVIVDEVPELIAQRPAIRSHLRRIAQAGRHAEMHLILGAQAPLVSELGAMRNIPVRIVGRVADRVAAYNAVGRGGVHCEGLRGRGDFVLATGTTDIRFQACYVEPELLSDWRRRYPPRPPRLPVRAPEESVPAGDPGRPLDDIPEEIVDAIRDYARQNEAEPPLNWVYRLTLDRLPTGGFNRDKARRALELARGGPP